VILGLHFEVALSLAYAILLIAIATALELVARKSHKRAEQYRNAGFVYFRDLDYFQCPAGQQLIQLSADVGRGLATYRAPAGACNACSLKLHCTDSEEGRQVERRLDTWIESEMRRFHRAISLTLLVLAALLLTAQLLRHQQPHDRNAIAILLIPLGAVLWKLLASLQRRRWRNDDFATPE
jgi:hypothetical protein